MADDIVTRLRRITAKPLGMVIDPPPHPLCQDAADEIERLRAALDYAVSELLPVHDHWGEFDHHEVVAHFLEEARDA